MQPLELVPASDPLDQLAALNLPGQTAEPRQLMIGSDVEIAARVKSDLEALNGEIVYTENRFWHYGGTHWKDIPDHILRLAVHAYDGAWHKSRGGAVATVKLNKSRVDSTLHEMAASLTEQTFFQHGATGINCANGFIQFAADGTPRLAPHCPDHRCRHTLPGRWNDQAAQSLPPMSMLSRLLGGVFKGDADAATKIDVLAEIIGAAALGHGTRLRQPRAVILKGETAENGKSQILDLARSLLPESAVCSLTAARMSDERHIVGLAGKLLNACDELSPAHAIASDTFKAIVTGEPVEGRDVYKSRLEFRPTAQHLFATNTLPVFSGGMDRGVQRRLLVITFNHVIPEAERIEGIGKRIGEEEPDLLLAWAVAGASRLLRQHAFTLPTSSKLAMSDWLFGADPVLGWLAEQVETRLILDATARVRTSHAYEQFRNWALGEGFGDRTLPSINAFVQRVQANAAGIGKGIEYRRTREGRFFYGMVIGKAASQAGQRKGW